MTETQHRRRWWTLVVLCLSLLVITIDMTIVNTALPTLARVLDADTAGMQWIVDAYTLAFAGLLLLGGALGDRFGRERTLTLGLVVFAAASTAAAFATTVDQLIAMRAVMGAGAALVMPATLGILTSVFTDGAERAKAISAWAAVSGVGVALGPTTAGYLLEHFDWGSVFLVNLPVITVALIAGRILIPRLGARGAAPLDIPGAALSVAAVTLLTWTLIEAPGNGWLSAATLGAAAGSAALLFLFGVWEQRAPAPLVELSLLRNPRFSAATAAVAIVFLSLLGMLFVLTQLLQFVLGYSPLEAGLAALPFAVCLAVTSPIAATLASRLGARVLVTSGLLVMGAGLVVMSRASVSSGVGFYIAAMIPVAIGMGLVMAPATDSIMSSVSGAKASTGAAMNNASREMGGVLGVAIVGSVTASLYASDMANAIAGLPPQRETAVEGSIAGALAVGAALGGSAGAQLVQAARESFVDAAGSAILLVAGLTFLGAVVAWRYLPGPEATTAVAPALEAPARVAA